MPRDIRSQLRFWRVCDRSNALFASRCRWLLSIVDGLVGGHVADYRLSPFTNMDMLDTYNLGATTPQAAK